MNLNAACPLFSLSCAFALCSGFVWDETELDPDGYVCSEFAYCDQVWLTPVHTNEGRWVLAPKVEYREPTIHNPLEIHVRPTRYKELRATA
jgi:hypothetical protein